MVALPGSWPRTPLPAGTQVIAQEPLLEPGTLRTELCKPVSGAHQERGAEVGCRVSHTCWR